MKPISIITFVAVFAIVAGSTSCKKDKTYSPDPINPSELITTVHLILSDSASSTVLDTVSFYDLDGPGGNAPQIDSMILQSGTVYSMRLVLLDESKSPSLDISEEISEKSDTHLFVFLSSLVQTNIHDNDANGNPLGLLNGLLTNAPGSGSYSVQLRHYDTPPLKTANSQNYETDIEIEFGLRVN